MEKSEFKTSLENNLRGYHETLAKFGWELYRSYLTNPRKAACLFLNSMLLPHDVFLECVQGANLNTGTSAGIFEEWYFYYIIRSAIETENISNVEVFNGYKIPFKWKGAGRHSKTNIDIAVVSKKPKRLLYCVEVKTNFEDNFSKYYDEQNMIYHHRTKTYPDFKYHYVTFSKPKKIIAKFKREVNTLRRRNELWIFPKEQLRSEKEHYDDELISKAELLLHLLYMPIGGRFPYIIELEDVDVIRNCGHGVEFHYGQRTSDREDNLIGFIDGFEWYHGDTNRVKVLLLNKNSKTWGEITSESPEKVIGCLKEAIKEVLIYKDPAMCRELKKSIFSSPNA